MHWLLCPASAEETCCSPSLLSRRENAVAFTGLWARRSQPCEPATETQLCATTWGGRGWLQKKTDVHLKMGRGGAPPCVDQDISDNGVNVSYVMISILSRKDVIYGGFSCLLTVWPLHVLIPTVPVFFSFPLKITALLSYNPQTLQCTCLKVYNSMTFHSIFTDTRRCNHYHNQL